MTAAVAILQHGEKVPAAGDPGLTLLGTVRASRATAAAMREVLEEVVVVDATVVLGSHGGATTDLLRDLLGDDELERRAPGLIRLGVPGGAVTTLTRDGGVWAVDQIADVAHIPATERTGHVPAGVVPPA